MDHVSANKTLPVTERENISGARVFDGEDQGKVLALIAILFAFLLCNWNSWWIMSNMCILL